MDFSMKQWRDQQQQQNSEEEQQHQYYSKIPRQMFFDSSHDQITTSATVTAAVTNALPLFVSQPNKITTNLSDIHSSTPPPRFSKLSGGGYCFSIAQWQELEVQALIFRHMMSGTAIPSELLQLVKRSLLASTTPYYFRPTSFLYGEYWGLGKGATDPEPGRCRRTDGKKWRCSRDVVSGHKYCERHMHRGRNRSRKHVELSSSIDGNHGGVGGSTVKTTTSGGLVAGVGGHGGGEIHLSFSNADAQLNQVTPNAKHDKHSSNEKSNKVLMQFFDDWPTSLQESSTNANDSSTTRTLTTSSHGNPSSDFLRLSTGNGDELSLRSDIQRAESGWSVQWGTNPMGGPLAEALRSSSNTSPTSVLHQMVRHSNLH